MGLPSRVERNFSRVTDRRRVRPRGHRSALDIGKRVGWAMGIEMGDAFARGFESGVKLAGEEIETLLLEARRAVAVDGARRATTSSSTPSGGAATPSRGSSGARPTTTRPMSR